MSEIIKHSIDCPGLIAANQDITVGEIIENHMIPKFPKAQGVTNRDGHSCIIFPGVDGNYRSDFNPVIIFKEKPTYPARGGATTIVIAGFIDMNTKETFSYYFGHRYRTNDYSSDITNSGNYTGIRFDGIIDWWEYTYDNIRSLGIINGKRTNPITMLSMDVMITKCKTLDTDEEVDVLMVASGYKMNNRIELVYPYKGHIVKSNIPSWGLPEVDKTINVYQFNDGNIYNDNLYVCFPRSHTLLKPLADFNSQHQPVHLDTWNKEAFTIGGKKFDLKLTSNSDAEIISIAKLSQ